MTRSWPREKPNRGVIESTVGMYGDLQGIAGARCQRSTALNLIARLFSKL